VSAGVGWMLAGLGMCAAELVHPGVFLLWVGLAAVGAGVVIWGAGLGFEWQVGVFLGLLAGLLSVPLVRRRRRVQESGRVNAPESGLIGKTCHALAFEGAEGRVSFRDGTWPARTTSGFKPVAGTVLRVVGLDGTTLLVTSD